MNPSLCGGRNGPPSPMSMRRNEWCATPEVGLEEPPPETMMAESMAAVGGGMQTDAEKPDRENEETHVSSICVESPSA